MRTEKLHLYYAVLSIKETQSKNDLRFILILSLLTASGLNSIALTQETKNASRADANLRLEIQP